MALTKKDIQLLKGTFATKEDLKRFATKEDLKRFATKEDLKRFATKEDLKRFATKEDLKRFATKDDLKRFATKDDLMELKSDLFNKIDPFLKEIMASREEQTVLAHQVSEHEDRLEKLEKIHPGGRHITPLS